MTPPHRPSSEVDIGTAGRGEEGDEADAENGAGRALGRDRGLSIFLASLVLVVFVLPPLALVGPQGDSWATPFSLSC